MARRSFKRHMISAFLQLVVLPMALLGALVMLWFVVNVQTQARSRLEIAAGEIRDSLDSYLEQHRRALDLLGHTLEQHALDAAPGTLGTWLDDFGERYRGVLTMLVADGEGRIIAGSPSVALGPMIESGLNVSDRTYFQIPMTRGGLYVSDAIQGRGFGNDPIVAISRRLEHPDGGTFGIVQASLNLELLAGLTALITNIEGAEMLILDSRSRVVAASDQRRYPFLSDVSEPWRFANPETCQVPLSRSCFTLSLGLDLVSWQVLVRQSPYNALRPLLLFLLFTLAALIMAVLVALLEGQRLARGTATPLAELADALTDSDLDGRPQLPIVPGSSPREVAVLHDAFEQLFDKLSHYNDRLSAQMEKLEAKVEQRTSELETSRSELLQILEGAPALIMSINESGQLAYANRAWRVGLGYDSRELSGMALGEIVIDEPSSTSLRSLQTLKPGHRLDEVQWCFRGKTGQIIRVAGNVVCMRDPHGEITSLVVVRDVTELYQAEQALRHKTKLLDLFVRHTPAAVAMFDLEMRYLAVSERWLKDYHLEEENCLGQSLYQVFPDLADRWRELHQRCLAGEVLSLNEDPYQHADGSVDWLRWAARPWQDADGQIGGLIIHIEVVTKDKQRLDRLRRSAERDPLTGLLNRRALFERLAEISQAAEVSGETLAVLFIDVDRFKQINDSHGHHIGDAVLKVVAQRLGQATRQSDLVSRLSSDKFVVVVTEIEGQSHSQALIERICRDIDQPIEIDGLTLRVTLSIGLSLNRGGQDGETMVRLADEAMFRVRAARQGAS